MRNKKVSSLGRSCLFVGNARIGVPLSVYKRQDGHNPRALDGSRDFSLVFGAGAGSFFRQNF